MGLAAGGEIKQNIKKNGVSPKLWDSGATIAICAHVFNSQDFYQITGSAPPPCPVTAAHYAAAGLPFFEMDEEHSKISGQFGMLKSVNEMDQERGLATGPEAAVEPNIIQLDEKGYKHPAEPQHTARVYNPDGVINLAGPLRKFRHLRDLEHELRYLKK